MKRFKEVYQEKLAEQRVVRGLNPNTYIAEVVNSDRVTKRL